ncbi:three component ABC system middle component [Massilia sp. BJB1822]|uniref:three component ABC system middle component n=1 Tax=Massilia sp. BJB1822 TaxID=2744470 RepID=UPI00159318A2|nr:three component ABC system middle component [Massilia sp. BJB1822]NVD96484.1 hypothetical protein [Massilia sp. BJB1822]
MTTSGYIDHNLIQNSALSCFLLTSFVKQYEDTAPDSPPVELMKALLVLPLLWHQASCQSIQKRNLATPMHAVLRETPAMLVDFRRRVQAYTGPTLQGLNLACASGLLVKSDDPVRPGFSTNFDRWPKNSRPTDAPGDMLRAIERLACWFSLATTPQLYAQLLKD